MRKPSHEDLKIRGHRTGRFNSLINFKRMDGFFRAGNLYAKADAMPKESHNKRMSALYQGWATKARLAAGENFVPKNVIRKKEKRQRIRLRASIAKEAREVQEKARTYADTVIERMAKIAGTSDNETAAIAAGIVLLERGYGKASQTNFNATIDANGKATDVSQKELDTRIEKAVQRVEELTGGAAKAPKSKKQPADIRKLDRNPDGSSLH